MSRVVEFKIHPWKNDKRHFKVYVAPSLTSMRSLIRKECEIEPHRRVSAMCVWYPDSEDEIGMLFFHVKRLDRGTVAHEISHASFRACESLGIRVDHWKNNCEQLEETESSEEQYAWIAERLTTGFWSEAKRLRLPQAR